MKKRFYTSGEVSELLGVFRSHFLYLVENGLLPGPSFSVPGRRLFTASDVEQIKEALRRTRPGPVPGEED